MSRVISRGMEALEQRPDLIRRTDRIAAPTLAEKLASAQSPLVLDVRTENEWQQKRIGESLNIPLNRLAERSGELPRDRPIVVHCGTGYRSSIATSLLEDQGFDNTIDLVGGFNAWEKCCPSNIAGGTG